MIVRLLKYFEDKKESSWEPATNHRDKMHPRHRKVLEEEE